MFETKKRAIGIGIMLVLTTFVGIAANVSADNLPPVANAGGPYIIDEAGTIIIDGSGSYDPDGDPLLYNWSINGTWTGWSSNPQTEYTWFGVYSGEVTLNVTDGSLYDLSTTTVTVYNSIPTDVTVTGPTQVYVGTELTLDVTFFDGNGRSDGSSDTYTAIFDWGDGLFSEISLGVREFSFSGTHIYTGITEPTTYLINITIIDNYGGQVSAFYSILVLVEPEVFTVDAGPDGIINEGSLFISAGSFISSGGDVFTGTVDYGDGSGPQTLTLNPDHTFDLSHLYVENGAYTAIVTIFKDGGANASDSALVTVNNVAPTATLTNNGPKDEGSPVTITFTNQYDPGVTDTFTYSFDWENDGIYDVVNQVGASATHTWFDNVVSTVKGRIMDNDGGFSEYTTVVTVNNVAPTAVLGNDGPKAEGSLVTISFSVQYDPGTSDTFTYSFDWNNDGTYEYVNQASPSMTHTWYDNGAYIVKGKIQDDDGGYTQYTTVVSVLNVPPTITSLSAPTCPVRLGKSINFTGVFTDPGTYDTHTALIAWGDGLSTTVNLPASVYQVSKNHTYGSAGLYVITLTVTDNDGGSDTKSINTTIVIYNPCGGYICGCGGYISPPGSYPANPNLTGCVCFSFSCKYKCGHTTPEGSTDFRFHFNNKRFYSTVYNWLVIVGKKAIYVGDGTINGAGHYGFRLTAIDGVGCHQSDKIRMKIWDKDNNNQIVYDTNYGASDMQDPTVTLSCGSITIYK